MIQVLCLKMKAFRPTSSGPHHGLRYVKNMSIKPKKIKMISKVLLSCPLHPTAKRQGSELATPRAPTYWLQVASEFVPTYFPENEEASFNSERQGRISWGVQ
jgi:hypothetical protein